MGNKSSSRHGQPREIFLNEEVTLTQKTRTRFVLIIAMCCSTVINKVEPEDLPSQLTETNVISNNDSLEYVPPPKKPLNSKPRVRRYGYRFTARVDPLVLTPDDLEALSTLGQEINKEVEDVPSPIDSPPRIIERRGRCKNR